MTKNRLGIVFLSIAALLGAGCASSNPAPALGQDDPSARPPQTGTNVPRNMQERTSETRSKRPAAAKRERAKAKPANTPKPAIDEEVVTRGGFR